MDTSFWKNLSPEIQIEYTSKKFFKQYLYKLDVYAPGCKSIKSDNIEENIQFRQSWSRHYSPGGSWHDKRLKEYLDEADLGFLYELQDLIKEYPEVKIRTEEPHISFYGDSHAMITSLAKAISPDCRHYIKTVTGPENAQLASILLNDVVLVKRKPKYKYRVWLREKQFSFEARRQVYNYLDSLGDLVKLTETTTNHLTKIGDWIWGSYFYTNDFGIVDFVRLINPEIIREVSELVYLDNK